MWRSPSLAKASEMSWRGYEDVPKVCRVCGGKVTLTGQGGPFMAHTDCVTGERTIAHTDCLRAAR